jgi:tRNA(Ile)-lysidine synthase
MVLDRVRRTIRQHALAVSRTRVVAAVSGGSDSVALAHILRELSANGELQLAGLIHLHHQLRASADADERFVRSMAEALGVPMFADREDVRARARRERRSIEDAGRAARYEFFERTRQQCGADVVALGHTRDDQAETFLLRLLRGAGPRGLSSIYPRNGRVVRPLLDCRRDELKAWLLERAIPYVRDETNDDVSIPRNRVRAELLPLLTARFNPSVVDVLADEAELSREAWAVLENTADEVAAQIVKLTDEGATIEIEPLRGVALPLRRIVLWRVMSQNAGSRPLGFDHVADALQLLEADGPRSLDAPGQRLERIGSRLVLRGRPRGTRGRLKPANPANLFWYPLSIPGEVQVGEAGCVVSAQRIVASAAVAHPGAIVGNGNEALVRGDLCSGILAVRNRRPGDRFKPFGRGSRKKLQDYFVDLKVRRTDRDVVPLVVDENDRIVWVAGFGIDEAFGVTDAGQAMLILRLSQARLSADRA